MPIDNTRWEVNAGVWPWLAQTLTYLGLVILAYWLASHFFGITIFQRDALWSIGILAAMAILFVVLVVALDTPFHLIWRSLHLLDHVEVKGNELIIESHRGSNLRIDHTLRVEIQLQPLEYKQYSRYTGEIVIPAGTLVQVSLKQQERIVKFCTVVKKGSNIDFGGWDCRVVEEIESSFDVAEYGLDPKALSELLRALRNAQRL